MMTLLVALCLFSAQIGAGSAPAAPHFEGAHFDHDAINVFPQGGKEFTIPLPPNLPATVNLVGFSPSGRSAYFQVPSAAVIARLG